MAPRMKGKADQGPGSLGDLDFLDDVAKPTKAGVKASASDDLETSKSVDVSRAERAQGRSVKRQPLRASKHHVSLYITPAVDRALKRIALDEERKTWEVYHQALREYLDSKGLSFDDLMRDG